MDYGRAIRIIRSARGLRQGALAAKAGLAASHVSLLETGRRTPSLQTLESIAEALGVPVYLLILLASDQDQLRGISQVQAREISETLLRTLLTAEGGHVESPQ